MTSNSRADCAKGHMSAWRKGGYVEVRDEEVTGDHSSLFKLVSCLIRLELRLDVDS